MKNKNKKVKIMERCCEINCINDTDFKECNLCGDTICEECYDEYLGYCSECYECLKRERTEEEKELWRCFWNSRF